MMAARPVLAALVLCVPLTVARAEQNTAGTGASTYVIVHGAWAGGWEWKNAGDLLQSHGHAVYRPTHTGQGERVHLASPDIDLDVHIQDVVNVILWEDLRDIILVGHSYGGMVITGVVDRLHDRVRHVIYVDAFLPEDGESLYTTLGRTGRERPAPDGFVALGKDHETKPPPHVVPQSAKTFSQPISLKNQAAAGRVPTTYILTVDKGKGRDTDGFFGFYERAEARGWKALVMEGDHIVHLTQTARLVEILETEVGGSNTAGAR